MAKIRYLIEVYHKGDNNVYSTSPDVSITDGLAFDNDASIKSTADSFSFRVQNTETSPGNFKYAGNIKIDDRVMIYITSQADISDSNKSSYLRFDGGIVEKSYNNTVDGRILSISGLNRLEKLMNFTYPGIFKDKTAPTIIQELVGHVNDDNPVKITFDTTNSDITGFDTIQYWRNYRPVFEMIEELSRQSINKKFNAYYYLTPDNNFIWKQKSHDTDELVLEEGVDFTVIQIREKVWDVINAMIVDCGKDCYGRGIHCFSYNEVSAAEYGLKWAPGIEVESEIAENIKNDQRSQATWVDANEDGLPDNYPFTMSFKERGDDGVVPQVGSNQSVANDAAFNSAIRKEAKWAGVDWINQVLDLTGTVRPKVKITIPGSHWETGVLDSSDNPLNQGDLVTIKCPSNGISKSYNWISGVDLRLFSISHSLERNGWWVTLDLEEDMEDFNPGG